MPGLPDIAYSAAMALLMGFLIGDEIHKCRLMFVFTRIDASYFPDQAGERFNYLYGRILTEPGRLPNVKPTTDYFRTTAGSNPSRLVGKFVPDRGVIHGIRQSSFPVESPMTQQFRLEISREPKLY